MSKDLTAASQMTLAEFERWIAQLESTGYRVVNPESVRKIRTALRAGGTMTQPRRAGG